MDTVLKRIETYADVQFARRFHSDVFVSLLDVTGQDLAGVQQRIEANNKEIEAEIIKTFPISYFVLRTGICMIADEKANPEEIISHANTARRLATDKKFRRDLW